MNMNYLTTTLFALALPLLIHAQTTVNVPASVPTVLVPFSTLPLCAQKCGPLFNAQGACTPPTVASPSDSCFCSYAQLQPFKAGSSGVCGPDSGCSAADLTNIQTWFNNFCKSGTGTTTSAGTGRATNGATATGSGGATSTSAVANKNNTAGQTWLSTHWKYVVMIVIIFVGLAALWIGGFLLRRRIHRKRDAAFEMRPPSTNWGAAGTAYPGPGAEKGSRRAEPMMAGGYAPKGKSPLSKELPLNNAMNDGHGRNEKRISKNRWLPTERT